MRQKVVLLIGAPFSGKTVVGRTLAEQLGFISVLTKPLLQKYRPDLIKVMDDGDVAPDLAMLELLEAHLPKADRVFIDSLRSADQVRWLRENRPNADLYTIYLDVDEKEILHRLEVAWSTSRGRREDDVNLPTRLVKFRQYSAEMLPVLRELTTFFEVNGNQAPEVVAQEVFAFCDRHGLVPDEESSASGNFTPAFAG